MKKFFKSYVKLSILKLLKLHNFLAESTPQDENVQMNISSILPLLQELTTFIKRCQQVASHIILQLNALYSTTSEGTLKVINASDIHLYVGKNLFS